MTENLVLIEKSFADAIAMIAEDADLPEDKRRHWTTSLRQFAKLADKPLEVIPARYSAVRADLLQLHHVPVGLTAKTLQNHRSNVKSALLYLAREKGIPEHGAPLSTEWKDLKQQIKDSVARYRLSSLMRYCSANGISPNAVEEAAIDQFLDYRSRCSKSADHAFRRLLARAWNDHVGVVAGWPERRLVAPPTKSVTETPEEAFRAELREGIDRYLKGLTKIRKNRRGQRIAPLKKSTIRTRRAELYAAARMAVHVGVPIEKLNSLSALLNPDVAERVLEAYWQKNGENPRLFTVDLAMRFLSIARETKCLNEEDCERLHEIWQTLRDKGQKDGLTDKNIAFLRQVLTPGVWGRVVRLPSLLMAEVRRQRQAPVRAAVTAQLAVAIAIESVAPIRISNLTAIKLGENLNKPDGPDSNYWLNFPEYDVKNRQRLLYPLEIYVTKIIDEYIHDFRPTLLRGRDEDFLFPGMRQGSKGAVTFSGQISKRISRHTGLQMTVHQFRHAAGAIILKRRPGEYELVRQLLGHKNVQTTIKCYIGLDMIQASEIYTQLVMEHLDQDSEPEE